MHFYTFTNPSARAGCEYSVNFFQRGLTGLHSEFSFLTGCLNQDEESSFLSYWLIDGRVLMLCEMQSASFRNWTRVSVSISYDNYHYTAGKICASTFLYSCCISGAFCIQVFTYYYYHHCFLIWEFFTTALSDGFSLESVG